MTQTPFPMFAPLGLEDTDAPWPLLNPFHASTRELPNKCHQFGSCQKQQYSKGRLNNMSAESTQSRQPLRLPSCTNQAEALDQAAVQIMLGMYSLLQKDIDLFLLQEQGADGNCSSLLAKICCCSCICFTCTHVCDWRPCPHTFL